MTTVSAGTIVYEVDMDTARLLQGRRDVDAALNGLSGSMGRLETSVTRTERSISSMQGAMSRLSGIAGAVMAALSVRQVAEYADAWVTLNNKLANALRPNEQLAEVTERVFNISQKTMSSLDATATLYARLERATRTAGTSTADLIKLTETINKGLIVSGATTQEASSTMIQLSQALASGVLRGEEFNSISENGSRLAVALAQSLGVTMGQLRAMAAQGKLTTDVVVKGLLSQGDQIAKEFSNTAMTLGQAFNIATNNVTKFVGESTTIKSVYAASGNAIVSLSQNIDVLSNALVGASAVMGSRFIGAMTMAISKKMEAIIASRQQVVAENQAAQSAALHATAELRSAEAAKIRALEEVRLAQMMKATAVSSVSLVAAEEALSAARVSASTATDNYNRALATNAAAQDTASAAAARASVAGGLLRGALSLIGGPVGAAMLAGAAIYYFWQRAQEARDAAEKLADKVDDLTTRMKGMSQVQLSAEIAKLRNSMPELTDAVNEAQSAYDKATNRVNDFKREIDNWGTSTKRGRQAQEALGSALDNQAIAADSLRQAQERLSRVHSTIGLAQAELNGQLKQGIDLLKRNGDEVGVVAGLMNKLGNAMDFAARAKSKFNSSNLQVERPKEVQKYLDKLSDQVDIQEELDDRLRAQLKAEKEIRALGGNDNDVRLARQRAAAEFDALQSRKEKKKEDRDAASEAKKAATQQENIAQKLANLKQQSEMAADSTRELSREQTILSAQQSLGKGASQEQIALAGKYAAEKWDTANALKAQAAAEKLLPEAKENASYKQDMLDLKTALDGKKISLDQFNKTAEQLEKQHQVNLAKIRAERSAGVTPLQDAQGGIDPVQQLANENARKLALINQFETEKGQLTQRGIELKNAQETQYEQARIAAQWEIYRNQSQANELLAASIDGFQSGAANAITGLINGTQSLQEAFANIGTTILGSVVSSLVEMGMQWVKSQMMGQAAAAASLASTMAQATAAAAAWAPAAVSASIATMGSAAAVGQTAYAGSLLSAKGLAVAGAREHGGPVSANSMYRVGEGGKPEIFKASNGSQYMIPGDNGSVISNRDMQGGGGGSSVVQHISFEINTTGGIDQATLKQMEGMMKKVALFQINDQANRPNGMIQPRRK